MIELCVVNIVTEEAIGSKKNHLTNVFYLDQFMSWDGKRKKYRLLLYLIKKKHFNWFFSGLGKYHAGAHAKSPLFTRSHLHMIST